MALVLLPSIQRNRLQMQWFMFRRLFPDQKLGPPPRGPIFMVAFFTDQKATDTTSSLFVSCLWAGIPSWDTEEKLKLKCLRIFTATTVFDLPVFSRFSSASKSALNPIVHKFCLHMWLWYMKDRVDRFISLLVWLHIWQNILDCKSFFDRLFVWMCQLWPKC